ncbi:hypothetical protein AMATHDRAFT_68892 [Amanita thiersii Skay4041]|uniref:Sulfhydryl oxidase n=1 Tax=Amanita thiersii Skay4041 TaxID=703135 RepID=A0A2A9NGL9_9AGAR|nr:hypothetical protein AMATHDRAFT_68892 [Amanita thiersii Skay4041]
MISRFLRSFFIVTTILVIFSTLVFIHPPTRSYVDPWTGQLFSEGGVERFLYKDKKPTSLDTHADTIIEDANLHGGVIMSKLGNATAKAELGRATWKLLHTMTVRYPENPTPDQRTALSSYFHLLSRLYPCGECAAEFQVLLKKYPPQTSSRRAASLWLCTVHNEVNKRLGKEMFDCANIEGSYDCGCAEEPSSTSKSGNGGVEKEDSETDPSVDRETGVEMIRGGR